MQDPKKPFNIILMKRKEEVNTIKSKMLKTVKETENYEKIEMWSEMKSEVWERTKYINKLMKNIKKSLSFNYLKERRKQKNAQAKLSLKSAMF